MAFAADAVRRTEGSVKSKEWDSQAWHRHRPRTHKTNALHAEYSTEETERASFRRLVWNKRATNRNELDPPIPADIPSLPRSSSSGQKRATLDPVTWIDS
ncbi:hypothetical protein CIHG_04973 [Coccidioides immitis H538.4]|uniref:Uncharacterized protein n=3 Tax=Coccidioides immitis TaxID=5501 RepID=A0A0J8TJU6_COCIT|nr:hypothetical protein CIRG_03903 [Coccidioides immitis RMSCC 2394]KMU74012.1 hypothetical protein CISG_10265 [Coccidioides immitis RMSCC 3703]KMU87033.1 hypothetical protein CIHG_04973 [Coccidioides immitis H538.4]